MATNNAINTDTIIGVTRGGSGAGTFTANGVLLGNTTSAFSVSSAFTANGQLLIGSGASTPSIATLTAGTGISITNGAGTITIASTDAGSNWSAVTTNTTLVAGNGYISNGAGTNTFTLPATAAVGDSFRVVAGAQGWTVEQGAGQSIGFGTSVTTTGAGGSLASSAARDTVEFICTTANTGFTVLSAIGNLTVV